MIAARVDIYGDRDLSRRLAEAARRIGDLAPPTRRAARTLAATATRLAPKRTGRLARANTVTVAGGTATVTNTVRYAPYVEEGTSRMRAQPFMAPAAAITPVTDIYRDHADRATAGI